MTAMWSFILCLLIIIITIAAVTLYACVSINIISIINLCEGHSKGVCEWKGRLKRSSPPIKKNSNFGLIKAKQQIFPSAAFQYSQMHLRINVLWTI